MTEWLFTTYLHKQTYHRFITQPTPALQNQNDSLENPTAGPISTHALIPKTSITPENNLHQPLQSRLVTKANSELEKSPLSISLCLPLSLPFVTLTRGFYLRRHRLTRQIRTYVRGKTGAATANNGDAR